MKLSDLIFKFFIRKRGELNNSDKKYLIVGLGNPGTIYQNTRHNIGFQVLDKFILLYNQTFSQDKYGSIARIKIKNKEVILLKPNTFMNLSGKSVIYWMNKEKISVDRIFIIHDDIDLPLGYLRIRKKGSDGGHKGMRNIIESLKTHEICRLRIGIKNDLKNQTKTNYVLGKWSEEELKVITPSIDEACKAIKEFVLSGIDSAMNKFNKKNNIEKSF